ncbi:hypothetical protein [Shimazuella alba]|uniref:Uncharacterized protein n=1 Tax=Shimazuella alba TaxID=2690964 RepID=A0A6I4VRI2_9BACL|nr:hypothetical protein [Shimazuella alba]MXQ52390.1 hypothetical protein [Shimazuella alba]
MFQLRSLVSILICTLFLAACSGKMLQTQKKTNDLSPEETAKIIAPFLPDGAMWMVPQYGKNRTPFFLVDFDHDQKEEVVGLFKQNQQLGLIVVQQEDDKWKKITQESFVGNQFQSAGAGDLTGDLKEEIVLSIEEGTEFDAQTKVLQWGKQQKLTSILHQKTTATVLEDLDQDKHPELIFFQKQPDMHTEATLYQAHQQKLQIKDTKMIDGTVEMSFLTVGKVQKNRLGIVADISVGAHGGKAGIYYIQNGRLHDVFDTLKDDQNNRLYNVKSQDINHDGIIDIAFTQMVQNSESLSNAEQPTIYRWFNWSEENQLKLVFQQYQDDILGLRLTFPPAWRGKMKASINPVSRTITFGLPLDEFNLIPIAEITAVKKSDWPTYKQYLDSYKKLDTFDYSILTTRNDVMYLSTIYNEKVSEQMNGLATYYRAKSLGMLPTHSKMKQWVELYHDAHKEYLRLPEMP